MIATHKTVSSNKLKQGNCHTGCNFDKLFEYLSADEYSPLKYYEILNDEEFSGLGRDEFIEVLVTPRFSKTKELSDTVKKISSLAEMFETITQQSLLDTKSEEAINGVSLL